jgi:hypothetical protein
MFSLELPQDLFDFLAAGRQLKYDPRTCEAGAVKLLPLNQLKLELFPMYITSEMEGLYDADPHKGENGYYHPGKHNPHIALS